MPGPTLVWFHRDLRLADHPALTRAVERGEPVVPVFVWAPDEDGDWPPGGAHRWWLHRSLEALAESLDRKTSRLVLRSGASLDALRDLIESTGADAVYWNTRYTPARRERDREIAEALREDGIDVKTFASRILHNPEAVRTTSDGPYHVYTPFRAKFLETVEIGEPLDVPRMGQRLAPATWPESEALDALGLLPEAQDGVDWAEQMERGVDARRARRATSASARSSATRSSTTPTPATGPPSTAARSSRRTSTGARSARGRSGTARRTGSATAPCARPPTRSSARSCGASSRTTSSTTTPTLPSEPLKDKFADFPWTSDADALRRWQRGQTGYPIVDAGMRQFWALGWMHNRVRMIVGSFLTKDLLIPWQDGEAWFWDTLVDGDLANNAMNWQWVGGSGPDAQPFFRIFNPVSQGEKHDPEGAYVRRWVPELSDLPNKYIHRPWEAPDDVLDEAGVMLGETYPEPIVDHAAARDRALAAYNEIK